MTLGWVIAGTVGQALLAMMLFLMVAFGFSAVGNTHQPTDRDFKVLDSALYLAPASCLFSAVIVIGLYRAGSDVAAYLWYTLPLLVFAGYWLYIALFITRKRSKKEEW